MEFEFCKMEIFVPKSHLEAIRRALQSADAGHIGNYDSCLSYSEVTGCWRPLEGSHPYRGEQNRICAEKECKVEVICKKDSVEETIRAVKAAHPYEVPVINVIPLYRTGL
ncbi:divalent cation tolerance protein CutA [Caproicibacter sp. BJN0012]|uniref:divalent cation tolerance protein CutA n=1 Tax=Caproicibacter sp. BJN0012 TaxID=3110227 RepID=UPI002E13A5C1|nr:divalent cation tolerance protein CutA [Caproicibacter sp. BJN0012]